MNDSTKLRIRVAELCGWRFVVHPTTGIGGYWERGTQGCEGYERGDWGSRELAVGLPDYPNDLNACHEFEKAIQGKNHGETWQLWLTYIVRLRAIITFVYPHNDTKHEWLLITATAEQRCRAFVATMENSK